MMRWCEICGETLERRPDERSDYFAKRETCGGPCYAALRDFRRTESLKDCGPRAPRERIGHRLVESEETARRLAYLKVSFG